MLWKDTTTGSWSPTPSTLGRTEAPSWRSYSSRKHAARSSSGGREFYGGTELPSIYLLRGWVNRGREKRERQRYRRMEPAVDTTKQGVLLCRPAIAMVLSALACLPCPSPAYLLYWAHTATLSLGQVGS